MKITLITLAENDEHGGAAGLGLRNIDSDEFNNAEDDCHELQTMIDKVNTWSKETPVATQSNSSSPGGDEESSRIDEKKIVSGEKLDECSKETMEIWNTLSWRSKLALKKMSWKVEE